MPGRTVPDDSVAFPQGRGLCLSDDLWCLDHCSIAPVRFNAMKPMRTTRSTVNARAPEPHATCEMTALSTTSEEERCCARSVATQHLGIHMHSIIASGENRTFGTVANRSKRLETLGCSQY